MGMYEPIKSALILLVPTDNQQNLENIETSNEDSLVRIMNQTIFSVTNHLEKFEFNTGVSDLMKANNAISSYLNQNKTISIETKDLV